MSALTVDGSRRRNKPRTAGSVLLACLLAAPPIFAKDPTGKVAVHVTAAGIPACRVSVTLMNQDSGELFEVKTADNGSYVADLPPAHYVVAVRDKQGRQVLKAPRQVSVHPGRLADVEITLAVPGMPQIRPAADSHALPEIQHRNLTCFVAGRESGVIAVVSPGATASFTFRTNGGKPESVEMAPFGPTGAVQARLRPLKTEDAPIEYTIEATNNVGTSRSPEVTARVVASAQDCGECDDVLAAAYPAALFMPVIAGGGISPILGGLGIVAAGATAAIVVSSGNASPSR
jgi:hypothetical protein